MGTKRKRWIIAAFVVIALAALAGWYYATRPQSLREVYAVQYWDPSGKNSSLRHSHGPLQLISYDRLIEDFSDDLYVYDLSCNLLWSFDEHGEHCTSYSACPDGTLFVTTNMTNLYTYNLRYEWQWKLHVDCFTTTPCQVKARPDGGAYLHADINKLYAVSPEGQIQWHVDYPYLVSPIQLFVTKDGNAILRSFRGAIAYGANGDELWRNEEISGDCWMSGTDPEILVCFSGLSNPVMGFSINGTKLWSAPVTGLPWTYTCADYSTGFFFEDDLNDFYTGIDLTGAITWEYQGNSPLVQACELADGRTVIVDSFKGPDGYYSKSLYKLKQWLGYSETGQLTVIDQQNKVTAKYALPFIFTVNPLIPLPDGTVLVAGDNGKLYRYEIP